MKRKICLLLIGLFGAILESVSQDTQEANNAVLDGTPQIIHYSRHDFNSDPQFWAVTEDKNGLLYFGNNDGALIFDGERWHKVKLPNNSSIRSLTTDSVGNVYAGGFNEFGLIKQNNAGIYHFVSLQDSLKFHDDKIENLWQVNIIDETIIYRSFNKLIAINGNKITKLPATQNFIRSYEIDGNYYVQDQDVGILKLDIENMRFSQIFTDEEILSEDIIAVLPTQQLNIVLGIASSGKIFKMNIVEQEVNLIKELFEEDEINKVESAIYASEDVYYLGTLSSGIVTLNSKGALLEDDNLFEGLQDKSVLNLFKSKSGNIWALLNNGLDCITFNSPVSTIFEGASLYDVFVEDDELYLATNQGVFHSSEIHEKMPEFSKIKGLEGQAWSFQNIKGDILVGHDKGLFKINDRESVQIGEISGIWKVIPVNEFDNIFLAVGYTGIYVVSKNKGQWRMERKISGFDESSRDIIETEVPGVFWICHGYKGVYRIKIDDSYTKVISFEHFTTQNGFKSPYSINVYKWQDQIVFTSNQGIYTYQKESNQFVPFKALNEILDPEINTRKLLQNGNKTWFVQGDEVGYFSNDKPVRQTDYFLQFKGSFNTGMECVVPLNEDLVLLGTKTGLYLFDLTFKDHLKSAPTLITGVSYLIDQQETTLPINKNKTLSLPNNTTSLRFDFASPQMQNDADIQYSFKLVGMDKDWSPWQLVPYKDYSHLRPGHYKFQVKSRSLLGTQGEMASFSFEISPLWYQTKWMIFVYIVIGFLIVLLTIKWVKRKIAFESFKTREEEQKSKKLLELELGQMKLQAEKDKIFKDKLLLQEDVIYKSKELANYTMLLVKKKDIFSEIRQDIIELRKLVKNDNSKNKLQKMYSKLNQHIIGEEYLHIFESNFEQVHHDFFKNLKERFQDLTQRELRLCAFIKMNLTNKEISPLLNISVRGVETARYRVRKKMSLEHESNLVEFLETISINVEDDVSTIITYK